MYSTKGLKSPLGGYFGHLSPIELLNVSHFADILANLRTWGEGSETGFLGGCLNLP
ncbi:hypothetical protein NIES39_O02200 [Arthrospira platensis NIES-39]|nr:hypothetical protein NIES39_O02200 [Arthrospira platensis NIES-39]